MPIPSVINATGGGTYTMEVTQFQQDLGLRDATGNPMMTTVWGYGQQGSPGSYPGPTFVARKDVGINVYWLNKLYDPNTNQLYPHLLPVDKSIHWSYDEEEENEDWLQQYGVPIVTHLHGGHTESASDGLPESWYSPFFTKTGSTFLKGDPGNPYVYDNNQQAATIWYHDHALGITRLNVYAGLAGFYVLTDNVEQNLQNTNKLPKGPYDIGLAIQDKMFTTSGELHYPAMPEVPGAPNPSVLPEFFGDFILVNGKIWPVLDVEPRQYRFRMLNGSDSRFYNLFLSEPLKLWQIGSDLGFLPTPVAHDQLLIAPGERKDVVIDFSNPALWGKTIILRNNARSPYPKGATPNPLNEGQIMAFRVSVPLNNAYALTPVPATLTAALPDPAQAVKTRKLILFEGTDEYGRLQPLLGTFDGAKHYMDAITEEPVVNTTEIWEIYNFTPDAHPIHLHLVSFRVL
ncbi:MAG: multicopper oxidase domain-containing protein, partial [Hymenobacteraceae bacterium]|nr:multicopper oxidase domain-containing protein [Hymenobacteraceae bacterium]